MRKVFISCTRPNMTDLEQHRAMKKMESDLRAYKFQQVVGRYMGQNEVSFLIEGVAFVRPFLELARKFNQDSIMVVSSYGGASVIPTNEDLDCEFIGEFKTTKIQPWGGDYSYNPRTQDYYICEELV